MTDEIHLKFTKDNYLSWEQFRRILKQILELVQDEHIKVKEFKLVTTE